MVLSTNGLQVQLDQFSAKLQNDVPQEVWNNTNLEVIKVSQSQITKRAKQRGEHAPFFTLPNAVNKQVSLSKYLEKGMVVLVWYRGGWCPYCNIMLHELQLYVEQIKAVGANLIAISPDMPDASLSTSEKHNLDFEILSDQGNTVGKEYGIIYPIGKAHEFYIDHLCTRPEQRAAKELPLAAVYIIDQTGLIRYAFLDADFRRRAEPYDIITTLQTITKLS